jgi:hypothetical protein
MTKKPPPKAKGKAKPKPHTHLFTKAETTNGWVIHWCSRPGCEEKIKRPRDKGSSGRGKK